MRQKTNQRGFSTIEGLLIVIIVLLIGFIGYYVWHSQKEADKTLNSADKISQGSSAAPAKKTATPTKPSPSSSQTQRYFTISEWKVRAPYSGTDTFNYKIDSSGLITVASKQLAAQDAGCDTFGAGQISRLSPDEAIYDGGPTAKQAAQSGSDYVLVGSYYYHFVHDQAACANNINDATTAGQNQANNTIKGLVAAFQAVPGS